MGPHNLQLAGQVLAAARARRPARRARAGPGRGLGRATTAHTHPALIDRIVKATPSSLATLPAARWVVYANGERSSSWPARTQQQLEAKSGEAGIHLAGPHWEEKPEHEPADEPDSADGADDSIVIVETPRV